MDKSNLPNEFKDNLIQLHVSAHRALEKARTDCESAAVIEACEIHLGKVEYLINRWTKG